MIELTCCPSTLQKGFSTYSPVALKELFNSQKVNHILPYNGMDNNETEQKEFQDNNKHMSISELNKISPANEHLTMQIASQVYNIPTAANGLCFFKMMNLPISHDVLTLHPMEENSEKKILLL